ncbi:MAG TPA: LysR family transcriptional regulator [Caulobacteraceae bacterium]|jgi:DNA-binding transcriptional LysR family regulator|nr:LysR family transcriptional regulator [Caulobacteraceae bacterium]
MNMPHLRTLDLNLLRVFLALLDEGSVTRAGTRLGLTQSAVSHALNRLRYGLDDQLFVRGPSGMQPTPRAVEIAPRVRQGLGQLQTALAPATFDPAESDRDFVIAAGAYSASVLLPEMIARVRLQAPRASIRVQSAFRGPVEELDAGRCDLVIGMFGRTPERFDSEPVFRDRMVWALRADHPAASRPLTVESLAALSHLAVATADPADIVHGSVLEQGVERRVAFDDSVLSDELTARGLGRKVALTLSDMHAALAVVARSDMTAAVPLGLVKVFGSALGLKAMEPPYPSPDRDIVALWRRDNDGPALQWLRGLLREAGAVFMQRLRGREAG